ncbi:hypothetical protein C9374_008499 [Naegleria lovaniensis]|uniref:RBR-type E3 ubiquitin transferase n=1 Tax=Naegleria lovaniensis TaxID=51637 RepID=A0AA88KHN3_NAELO|nr:uncharacterized protein C9374_008499 [Naegleria lovaniensis]KAG2378356.1 hypothetical protein C9374_008499 [Naegleria lovaniensis]
MGNSPVVQPSVSPIPTTTNGNGYNNGGNALTNNNSVGGRVSPILTSSQQQQQQQVQLYCDFIPGDEVKVKRLQYTMAFPSGTSPLQQPSSILVSGSTNSSVPYNLNSNQQAYTNNVGGSSQPNNVSNYNYGNNTSYYNDNNNYGTAITNHVNSVTTTSNKKVLPPMQEQHMYPSFTENELHSPPPILPPNSFHPPLHTHYSSTPSYNSGSNVNNYNPSSTTTNNNSRNTLNQSVQHQHGAAKNPSLKIATPNKTKIVDDFVLIDPASPLVPPPTTGSVIPTTSPYFVQQSQQQQASNNASSVVLTNQPPQYHYPYNSNYSLLNPSSIRYDITVNPVQASNTHGVHWNSLYQQQQPLPENNSSVGVLLTNTSTSQVKGGYLGQPGRTPVTGQEHPQFVMPPPPVPINDLNSYQKHSFPTSQYPYSQMAFFYPYLYDDHFYNSVHIVKSVKVRLVPANDQQQLLQPPSTNYGVGKQSNNMYTSQNSSKLTVPSNPNVATTSPQLISIVEITLEDDPYQLVFSINDLEQIPNEKHHQRRIEYRIIERYVSLCRQTQSYVPTSSSTTPYPVIDPVPYILDLYTEHIKKGIALVRLDLVSLGLGDEDVKCIAWTLLPPWSVGSSVRRLNLSGNKITSKGAQYISNAFMNSAPQLQTKKMSNSAFAVKELDLSFNKDIGFIGAQFLAGMLIRNTSLTYINLAQTGITPQGCDLIINALIQNNESSIIKLDLRHDMVGEEQIKKMCKLVEIRKSLCFLEFYPYKEMIEGSINEGTNEEGWLSYDGWVKHAMLRELLEKNVEYMKNHPSKLQKKAAMSINKTPSASPSTIDNNLDTLNSMLNSIFSTISGTSGTSSTSSKEKELTNDTELSFDNDIFSLSMSSSLKTENVVNYLKLSGEDSVDSTPPTSYYDDSSIITCAICYEDKKPTDGTVFFMEECEHKFCSACIFEYVKDKIEKGEVDSIQCPECNRNLSVMEVKQILNQGKLNKISQDHDASSHTEDDDLFAKYEEFSLKRALGGMKDLLWCPNPKCGNAIIVEATPSLGMASPMSPKMLSHKALPLQEIPTGGEPSSVSTASNSNASQAQSSQTGGGSELLSPIPSFRKRMPSVKVHCSHCGWDFCSKCVQKYHPGLTCEENDARNKSKQDEQFKEWMKDQGAKVCPTCGAVIQKTRGCNSMQCSQCNTKFCYYCGKAFDSSEREHYKNCYKWSLFGFNL